VSFAASRTLRASFSVRIALGSLQVVVESSRGIAQDVASLVEESEEALDGAQAVVLVSDGVCLAVFFPEREKRALVRLEVLGADFCELEASLGKPVEKLRDVVEVVRDGSLSIAKCEPLLVVAQEPSRLL
jgi:hypothetical protein